MKIRKALTASLASVILAGSCITPAAVYANDPPLYGDVNLDSSVDVSDAVMVARFCVMDAGLLITDYGKACGDVNADSKLDDKDLVKLLRFIAKQVTRSELGMPDTDEPRQQRSVSLMEGIEPQLANEKAPDRQFIASQMKLTADLLKAAANDPQSAGKNLMISPLSVSQALAMTANGANGNTKAEMEQLLGDTIDLETLNRYYAGYTAKLSRSEKVKLNLANAIWIKDDSRLIQVPEAFLQTTADYYHADAYKAPFNDTTAADINGWVYENTFGMIPELLDEINPDTVMMLVNAVAFDGEWASPFSLIEEDEPQLFHAYDGDMSADMMRGSGTCYLQDEHATGFIKRYAGGYSFAGILPDEDVTVSDYLDSMTGESLQAMLDSKDYADVIVTMPKFSDSYDILMNDMLMTLGMKDAFDPAAADLTGLNALGNTCIDFVLHKTFIEVNEKGTKAAAVTGNGTVAGAIRTMPQYITLDRPFIYMILDNETNLPVFIGTVMHPTAAEAAED